MNKMEIESGDLMFKTIFDCVEFYKSNPGDEFVKTNFENGILRGCVSKEKILFIHYIEIKKEFQNTGILRNFLHKLDQCGFSKVYFLGVQSQILDDYLVRFVHPKTLKKFSCQGGDWSLELL